MDKSTKRKMILAAGVTIILAVLLFINEISNSKVSCMERNTYGGGSKKEQYDVTVGKSLSKEAVDVEIGEREYTEKEIQKVFKQTMDRLEKTVLGKNKSVDHVEYDLNLVKKLEDVPLEIEWESSRDDIINILGEVQEENLTEKGELVELKGFLKYGEEECLYILNVRVYPRTLTAKGKLIREIKELVAESDMKNKSGSSVVLPEKVRGERIVWERRKEHKAVYIVFLGAIITVLIYLQEKQKKEQVQKERQKQMKMDYPEIVSQISLLTGAGITVKNAWKKIVSSYQENKEVKGVRYAYEEMAYTLREMQGGVPEAESYVHFGRRCQGTEYMKLGALLSQNIRKGTKGLVKILDVEAGQALEEKRQMAKRRGEETSTKLLLPMSIMLIVVLIIVIVPAFLSITL